MTTIPRNTKPKSDYHQWAASELTNGDILGVEESLGRAACWVTVESIGGASTIRFNVVQKVRKSHRFDNPWVSDAEFWEKPGVVEERLVVKDNIVIETDAVQTWTDREICVRDIEIVTKSSGLKITIR